MPAAPPLTAAAPSCSLHCCRATTTTALLSTIAPNECIRDAQKKDVTTVVISPCSDVVSLVSRSWWKLSRSMSCACCVGRQNDRFLVNVTLRSSWSFVLIVFSCSALFSCSANTALRRTECCALSTVNSCSSRWYLSSNDADADVVVAGAPAAAGAPPPPAAALAPEDGGVVDMGESAGLDMAVVLYGADSAGVDSRSKLVRHPGQ